MNRYFLIGMIFLFIISVVHAEDFDINLKLMDTEIIEGTNDAASFNLTITNTNVNNILNFRVYTLQSIEWDVVVEDSTGNTVRVYPDSTRSFLVKIRSIGGGLGTYTVPLNVRPQSGDGKFETLVPINIVSADGLYREYIPDIRIWVDMENKKINPKNRENIKITLKNENPRNIEDLNIELTSRLINKRKTISLGPFQEKAIEFTVSFDPLEPPKKDILSVRVWTTFENQSYPKKQPDAIEYEIIAYSNVEEDATVKEKFLKTEKRITVSNNGNVNKEYAVKIETTPLKQLFTYSSPRAEILKEGGERYLVWNLKLNAETKDGVDTETIVLVHNYRILFFIIILIIIGVIGYYLLRDQIVIKKSAIQTTTEEEGILGLKVIIHIKNRGKTTIEDVRVIDKIPNIAKLEKEFQVGTLKPSKILRGKTYISLKWDIHALESLEERIITYKIKSSLRIIGGIKLHPAIIKYKNEKAKEVIVHSNMFNLQQ